jgi:hypothetical protein
VRALEDFYRPGFNYVKAGVTQVDVRADEQSQGELDLETKLVRSHQNAAVHARELVASCVTAGGQVAGFRRCRAAGD